MIRALIVVLLAGAPAAAQWGAGLNTASGGSTTGVDAGEDANLDDLVVSTIRSTGTAPSATLNGIHSASSVTVNSAIKTTGGLNSSGPVSLAAASMTVVGAGTRALDASSDSGPDALRVEGENKDFNTSANPVNLLVVSNTDQAADKGGTIGLGGDYLNNFYAVYGMIKGAKEDGNNGSTGGYLALGSRTTGENVKERMRLSPSGNIGVNDTTPDARLETLAAAADNFIVQVSSQDDVTKISAVDKFGHFSSSAAVNASLGTCTNGTLVMPSNDGDGAVTFSGANTACAINFANTYPSAGVLTCMIQGNSDTSRLSYATHTMAVLNILNTVGQAASDRVEYRCQFVGM